LEKTNFELSFNKLLVYFPAVNQEKELKACKNFHHQFIDPALRVYVVDQAPRYLEYMARHSLNASLQHYLVYYFFAKDYIKAFQDVEQVYNISNKNEKTFSVLRRWIKNQYIIKDEGHLATWYLKHLMIFDKNNPLPKHHFAQSLLQQLKDPNKNIEEEEYQKSSNTKKKGIKPKKLAKNVIKVITKKRPEAMELIQKMEGICVGQRLKKIPIILGIPEEDILALGNNVIPNCNLESRVSQDHFNLLRPGLLAYLKDLLEKLPETMKVEIKKRRRAHKPSPSSHTSKYSDFVRIIYTNM
jgi:hypothetical protein